MYIGEVSYVIFKVLKASREDYLFALKVAKHKDNIFDIKYYENKLKSVESRIASIERDNSRTCKPKLYLVKG